MIGDDYQARLAREHDSYRACAKVHDLPGIAHYWSHRFLKPKLAAFGFDSAEEMFSQYLIRQCERAGRGTVRFLSIGAGNCDQETRLARQLRQAGHTAFQFECVEINATMLERAAGSAAEAGVSGHLELQQGDFNTWRPRRTYDAVIANQSLHHVVELEHLFAQIREALAPGGVFLISDIIGRNGHQRWPEALSMVNEFWRKLPPSYRFNQSLRRYEELHMNWDCSAEGFEGIRAQDILPLLIANFHFRLFVGFANLIDPFIDRSFGLNFDADAEWDRAFIDGVQARDETELQAGRIKPTRMIAVLANEPGETARCVGSLSPQASVRRADAPAPSAPASDACPLYQWNAWPHDIYRELEIVCGHLADDAALITERTAWALQLRRELAEKSEWALGLRDEVRERTAWAQRMETNFEERTAWAFELQRELAAERAQRTAFERHVVQFIRHPLGMLGRMARRAANRCRGLLRRGGSG